MPMLYFDHAASQPPLTEVVDFYRRELVENFANPSASHRAGKALFDRIHQIRLKILNSLNAKPDDLVVFTASATEANNLIISGLARRFETAAVSKTEHPSLIKPIEARTTTVKYLNHNQDYEIDEHDFQSALETCDFVGVSQVNNTTGMINQFDSKIYEKKMAHLHWDLSQSYTKIPFDFSLSGADSITLSGHKFGAPKGIGILVVRKGIEIRPQILGGGHEQGLRSGTLNYPLISTVGFTIDIKMKKMESSLKNMTELKKKFINALLEINSKIEIPFEKSSPFICTIKLPVPSSDIVMRALEDKGVVVSTSAACSSKNKKFSPVFDALGFSLPSHSQMMRISFSPETTLSDVESFIDVFKEVNKMMVLFGSSS
ncbi:MAG: cysteine desulfurase family protein [Bacteriovoracaceae bacterium]